ncbi:MAG: FadR/GntR family transcriptional regulator [Azospira sp.]|jgi:GntR family transcriptional repressor for pyruvate dehydrogenase complex|nr:FadR/GntR family transcriptional regulator [Azospira sp.]
MPLETLSRIHRSPRLSEEVSAALEARILRGDHPPGSQLPTEKVFAETFGVSRAVVREAIARLKADGLIETRQGAGAFVAENPKSLNFRISPGGEDGLLHIFELRTMVEITVAELAARRRTDADVAAMRDALRRMDEALASERDGSEADDDFHLAIAAATHNQYVLRLCEFLGRQFSESRRMAWVDHPRGLESPRQAQREHAVLLEAIAAGDPVAARRAAYVHLSGAAERVAVDLPSDLGCAVNGDEPRLSA